MKDNNHTDEQINEFANQMLDLVEGQREDLLNKIKKFHEPACTAPDEIKEGCTLEFTFVFLTLLDDMLVEREMEKAKNGI